MKIVSFEFTWTKGSRESHKFTTPNEAIEYFTAMGYGMYNWEIRVTFDDMYDSTTQISLLMFNYITDHWSVLEA